MEKDTKEISDAVYESDLSQASIHHWYDEFKSGRKSAELMGRPGTPTTVLTKQSTLAQPWYSTIFI